MNAWRDLDPTKQTGQRSADCNFWGLQAGVFAGLIAEGCHDPKIMQVTCSPSEFGGLLSLLCNQRTSNAMLTLCV